MLKYCIRFSDQIESPFQVSGRRPGLACVFPFRTSGRSRAHSACTREGAKDGRHWCATRVDDLGRLVRSHFGHCREGCPREEEDHGGGVEMSVTELAAVCSRGII